MAFELTGQTALVTGAATGIGEAIARRLAKAGAAVAVADLNLAGAAQVARSIGGSAFPLEIDIARSESADAAIAAIIARHGQIDILVNNAGVGGLYSNPHSAQCQRLEKRRQAWPSTGYRQSLPLPK